MLFTSVVDDDLLVLHPSREKDPNGAKLAGALHAHLQLERKRVLRELLVYVTAVVSIALWPLAMWPTSFPISLRGFVLAAWLMAFAGLALVWIQELRCRRARARLAGELGASDPGLR